MRLSKLSSSLLATIGVLVSATASAGPAWEFTSAGNSFNNNNWIFASAFNVLSDVTASGLGYYADPNNGFVNANHVALYECDNVTCTGTGNLLASATVDNTYPLTGHFRYVTIAPILLQAGHSYEVVGVSFGDNYTWNDPGFATDPNIVLVGDGVGVGTTRWELENGQGPKFLNYVNYNEIEPDGFWGPNVFLGQPTFAPEPASLLLAGLGLAGLGWTRRRRAGK